MVMLRILVQELLGYLCINMDNLGQILSTRSIMLTSSKFCHFNLEPVHVQNKIQAFEDYRDADDAVREMNNKELMGER